MKGDQHQVEQVKGLAGLQTPGATPAGQGAVALTPPASDRWTQIQAWAQELGFSQIGVAGIDLSSAEPGLAAWMAAGFAGSMHYFEHHGLLRARPAELVPGTVSVITARMNYLPQAGTPAADDEWLQREWRGLADPMVGQVALYARGRDYHRVLRPRLAQLAKRITQAWGAAGARAFTDSAPVLEAELAVRSGLGWRGKHTLVLDRDAGSMFFLGELFIDFALPPTEPAQAHCGTCRACIEVCPTQAIVAPGQLDARRCISYLTIEHDGPIPLALRPAIGNRIYGCDDCQLACPWNKFARRSPLPDFDVREPWQTPTLLTLWQWEEADFDHHTQGSAIRRIGYARFMRNVAVALGNALAQTPSLADAQAVRAALTARRDGLPPVVAEHVHWALRQGPEASAHARGGEHPN